MLLPCFSVAQDRIGDAYNNLDRIVKVNGEQISCTIDRVNNGVIYYHIKRLGMDPRGSEDLPGVTKYFYRQQWFNGNGVSTEAIKARNLLLAEKIHDAIAAYSLLVKDDSTNAILLAEDAYALALAGIYDAALMRLDRARGMVPVPAGVNYFSAQVFALMGYEDISSGLLKKDGVSNAPVWIATKSTILLQRFRCKSPAATESREDLVSDFRLANKLAAQNATLQSISLFHKLIDLCPKEYILYVGYSTVLESVGLLDEAVRSMERALSFIGNKEEDRDKEQFLEQRLVLLKRKQSSVPAEAAPGDAKSKNQDAFRPQLMAYAGGMIAPSMINVNGRVGYYLTGSSNASFDFGVTGDNGTTTVNLGLSGYVRQHVLVAGGGLLMTSGGGTTALSVKISLGISKLNKRQTSSFDVFLDGTAGLGKSSVITMGITVGESLYFGKRK